MYDPISSDITYHNQQKLGFFVQILFEHIEHIEGHQIIMIDIKVGK